MRDHLARCAQAVATYRQPVADYHAEHDETATESKAVHNSLVRLLVRYGMDEREAKFEVMKFDKDVSYRAILGTAKPNGIVLEPGVHLGEAVVKTATNAQALVARNTGLFKTRTVADSLNVSGRINMTFLRERHRSNVKTHINAYGGIDKDDFRRIGQEVLNEFKHSMLEKDVYGQPVSAADQADAKFNPVHDQ